MIYILYASSSNLLANQAYTRFRWMIFSDCSTTMSTLYYDYNGLTKYNTADSSHRYPR